jgi:uracil phosphoribosyltransferase
MRLYTKLAGIALVLAVAGCGTVPIQNVDQAPVPTASGKTLTKEQVRIAIIRAGDNLGWKITDEGPNMMVGKLALRKHLAVVEIPYTAGTYSIKYRSSVELDEKDGKIHKNYNGWIQNLTRGINSQLSTS